MSRLSDLSRPSSRHSGQDLTLDAALENARESALQLRDRAAVAASTRTAVARDWASPQVERLTATVRDEVVPTVTAAVLSALAATEPVREEAVQRGNAAVHALKGDLRYRPARRRARLARRGRTGRPDSGGSRGRRLLVLVLALGGAYAGWRAWASTRPDPWEDLTTTPNPTPVPPESTAESTASTMGTGHPVGTDDDAAASPDEALADSTAAEVVAAEDATGSSPSGIETVQPVQPGQTGDHDGGTGGQDGSRPV